MADFYTFRPLGAWTEKSTRNRRPRGTFSAPWSDTVELLRRELGHLRARNVVIQADFAPQHIRVDGTMPLASAPNPEHPGVRIAFESIHGPLTYATDSCAFWQHNVRSIALGLQALRAVDRYGVTKRGEQYRGWSQLPAGATPMPAAMSEQEALDLVAKWSTLKHPPGPIDPDMLRRSYRSARAAAHPDRTGDSVTFLLLEQAGQILGIQR